jgi:hypothetical protein
VQLLKELGGVRRRLWQAKAFTVTVVVTLAAEIAGTTIMFALVDGRPDPIATLRTN